MFSWEYPPANVGGLSRHVYYLSRELARRGHVVEVVTQAAGGAPERGEEPIGDGLLRVWRKAPYDLHSPDFLHWVHQLNYSLLEAVLEMGARPGAEASQEGTAGEACSGAEAAIGDGRPRDDSPIDIVHAHDWLVAFAARATKHALRVPLVATIHATEAGRHNGIHNPWQRYISEVEWWLTYEAWRVICCSAYMESELAGQFRLPEDKMRVIPNGITFSEVESEGGTGAPAAGPSGGPGASGPGLASLAAAPGRPRRERFAQPGEEIVYFVGRLVREKGVDTLLDAFPAVLERRPSAKLVIGGTGPHEGHLRGRVTAGGLGDRVVFTGYVDDVTRNLLYRWSSVAVVPSYYEPFGLTALEAMAAGAPLVVSDTGGLSETVEHGVTGLKVPPADPGELAGAILALLADRDSARRLGETARATVTRRYAWPEIARLTESLYEEVVREARESGWSTPGRAAGEDWGEMRRRTRHMTRGLEPIGRYNPPS